MNKLTISKLLFTLSFLYISNFAISQNGPGGVGSTDGSSNLKLWLRADKNVNYGSLDSITSWDDYSGNSNNLSNSATKPLFDGNTLNGLPVIDFSSNAAGLESSNVTGSDLFSTNQNTIIFVKNSTSGDTWFYWEDNPTSNFTKCERAGNSFTFNFPDNANSLTSSSSITGSYNIIAITTDNSDDIIIYLNSSNDNNTSHTGTTLDNTQSADLYLGTEDGTATNGWTGYIAEAMIYNTLLNSAQLIIIENALSGKYNLVLDANDEYAGDNSGNGNFDFDIVGIGQESDGDHTTANSAGVIIAESGATLDNGEYVIIGHSNLVDSASVLDCPSGVQQRWNRSWYLDRPDAGSVDIRIAFDFSEGIDGSPPASATDYRLLYRNTNSGDFAVVAGLTPGIQNTDQVYFDVANASLSDGYYSFGTVDKDDSPVTGGNIWYSYLDGDWDEWTSWTLDPDGSLLLNDNQGIPGASDSVIIINNVVIDIGYNNKQCAYLEIRSGIVDLGATSGHDFNTIKGGGRIRLQSDNFPAGDTTDFITQGSVEYMGDGTTYSLSSHRAYYDLVINLDNATDTIVLLDSLTVNNEFKVQKGVFQINGHSGYTDILSITVSGDFKVQSNGAISVGTGNTIGSNNINGATSTLPSEGNYHKIYHQLYVYGDFTNTGTINFSNQAQPDYDDFTTMGAVSVYMKGSSDKEMKLYDTTDFYNLIIDKGSDLSYTLTVYSSDNNYFRLFGPNSVGRLTSGFAVFTADNPEIRKALWVYHGNLKLTGNILIPSLTEGNDYEAGETTEGHYNVGSTGCLWLAGSNVSVYSTADAVGDVPWGADGVNTGTSNQAFGLLGKLTIDNGTLGCRKSAGFIYYTNNTAQLIINGGSMDISQLSGSGEFSFNQTGGTLTVRGDATLTGSETDGTEPIFNINNASSSFQMSGGEIIINDITTTANGDFYINSDDGNYSVTGGKVTFSIDGGSDLEINTNANIWNVDIERRNASGTSTYTLIDNLTVSNDLLVDDNTTLILTDGTGYDLTIGGDFTMETSAQVTAVDGTEDIDITFNGSGNSIVTIENTTNELNPYDFNISKESSSDYVQLASSQFTAGQIPLTISNDFTIDKGVFDYAIFNVEVNGDLNNSGTMGTDTASGRIELTGKTSEASITTSISGNPTYGHIELDDSDGGTLVNDAQFNEFTLTTGVMDIDEYRLTLNDTVFGSGYSTTKMIKTAGSVSDGGLRIKFDVNDYAQNERILYPVGSYVAASGGGQDEYMPATVNFVVNFGLSDEGYYTVVPADGIHPANNGVALDILEYYWRTKAEGFNSTYTDSISLDFESFRALNRQWFIFWWVYWKGYYSDYDDWYEESTDITTGTTTITFDDAGYAGFINGEYSSACSDLGIPFIGSDTYYSRNTGDWDNTASWSLSGHNIDDEPGGLPGVTDYIIIGDNDVITIPNAYSASAAKVEVKEGATFDFGSSSGHDFTDVYGAGKIQFGSAAAPTIPAANFDDLLNNDTATVEFRGSATYTIPSSFTKYPNLIISGTNGKTFPNQNIIIQKNLYIDGETATLNNDDDVEVYDSIIFDNTGILQFPNGTNACVLTVNKSIDLTGSGDVNELEVEAGNTNNVTHSLIVKDDILMNDDSLALFRSANENQASLYFQGDSTSTVSGTTANLELYDIYIQKDLLSDSVILSVDFNLNDSTIDITNGTFELDNTNIDIYAAKDNVNFDIPSTGAFIITNGTARLTGSSSGITLDGKLGLANSSQLLMASGTDDNYIEYSSSGVSEISIEDNATLTIGSQIRRGTISSTGALTYSQTGGTVTVGNNSAPETTRGVFELLNAGSSFTFTDGDIIIVRSALTTSPALYLDPASNSVSSGAYITLGKGSTTPNNDIIGLYIDVPVKNIRTIDPAGGNSFEAKIFTVELSLDTLNIAANTTLNCNEIDIDISGDFINSGTFNGNNNTTTFNGTKQTIYSTGTSNFYDMTFSTSDTVFIDNDITIDNELTISVSTVVDDQENTINLKGDLRNSGTHYSSNPAAGGITLNGTSLQEIYGTGSYGNLELNNSVGAALNNNFSLSSNALTLTNGKFYLRNYLFSMGENSSVSGTFSSSCMLVTNGALSDAGVKKNLNSGTTNNILIPVGTPGKYTPIELDITTASAGNITFKPINEAHPTTTNKNNVLQYYWNISNASLTDVDADFRFNYVEKDISVTGANLESDYIPAYLEDASWAKFGQGNVNATNNTIDFNFYNKSTLAGNYTAGIDTAIPDDIPVYITRQDGNWESNTTWKIQGGADPAPDYPDGHVAQIEHEVTITQHLKSAYKTIIDTGGILNIDSTIGHYFGTVSGYGHMKLERGKLAAGNYDSFFACNGGSIEFAGSGDYTIPDEGITYRRLILSGSGDRIIPDQDITICDTLEVDGTDLDNSPNDRDIYINGWFELTGGGTFNSGTGGATVIYNGSSQQTLGGFTGSNKFHNFTINNSNGISLDGNILIDGTLTLTSGVITTNSNTITLEETGSVSPAGGSSSSYVDSVMVVKLANGSSFAFPVGNSRWGKLELLNTTTTGVQTWKVSYVNGTHADQDAGTGVTSVSSTEYWHVTNTTSAGSAEVKLRWDDQSDVNGVSAGAVSNIRLAQYDGSTDWDAIGTSPSGSDYSGTVTSDATVSFSLGTTEDFLLGSTAALLATANFVSSDFTVCPGVAVDILINLTGTANWSLDYNIDGTPQTQITGITSSPYTLNTSTTGKYTLEAVSDAGGPGTTDDTDSLEVANHTAVVADATTADANVCLGEYTTLDATGSTGTGTLTYSWDNASDLSNASSSTPVATPTATTTYTVTVTDDNSCSDSDGVLITMDASPTPSVSGDNPACALETANYLTPNVGGNTYSWSMNPSGRGTIDTPTANSTDLDWNQVTTGPSWTTYVKVTETVTASGCSASDSLNVTIYRKPATGNKYALPND